MTNEEKAQELAIKYCKEIDPHGREVYNIGCGIACCEMAEWKEQQMIDKACKWLKDNVNDYVDLNDWDECIVNKDDLLYDFKKAMTEGGKQ